MSDSDDNAFASADEGEHVQQKGEPKPAIIKEDKKSSKALTGATDTGGSKKSSEKEIAKPSPSVSQKEEEKKGKGKQQRNKKGKGGKAASAKNSSPPKQETKKSESQRSAETDDSISFEKTGRDEEGKDSQPQGEPDKSNTEHAEKSDEAAPSKNPVTKPKETTSKQTDSQKISTPSKDSAESSTEKTPQKIATSKKDSTKSTKGKALKEDGKDRNQDECAVNEDGSRPAVVESPKSQSIAASERDHHTAEQEKVLHKLEETASSSGGGWGWSSWGSSLLSAASNSVQTFTHQVEGGFNTIMDTVESSLAVPDPKSLAEKDAAEEKEASKDSKDETVTEQPEHQTEADQKNSGKISASVSAKSKSASANVEESNEASAADQGGGGWFSSWGVGDLAKKVQDTGKSLAAKGSTLMTEGFDAVEHLAAGGIDVLENIGKKTYSTLSEHDPALRRTRQFLSPRTNKANLSSVLKEAREKAEQDQKHQEETSERMKANFGMLFDDYQGIAHLEALEMLSNQSEKKVHSLLNSLAPDDLTEIKPRLIDIKNAFQLDDEEESTDEQDFPSLVNQHLSELQLGTAPDKLNTVHQMVLAWITDFDAADESHSQTTKETHEKSIQALAELTAKGVEQFHKAGELVLLEREKVKDITERAHSLARLTGVLCHEVGNLSNKFVDCLNKLVEDDKSDDVTTMITNIYLEASNSSTYIQDAFSLLLPVLQHATLEQHILARGSS